MATSEDKRFQISVLDMETADLMILDTDFYFLSHETEGEAVVRTEKVSTQDALLTMVALKRLLHETLKKQLVKGDALVPSHELDALFDEVFNEMLNEVMSEPIEMVDGDIT